MPTCLRPLIRATAAVCLLAVGAAASSPTTVHLPFVLDADEGPVAEVTATEVPAVPCGVAWAHMPPPAQDEDDGFEIWFIGYTCQEIIYEAGVQCGLDPASFVCWVFTLGAIACLIWGEPELS